MITYSKALWGTPLLLMFWGSAIPRALMFAICSTVLTGIFYVVPSQSYWKQSWSHPYPYQIFAYVVGFTLVFRTNFGYQRYWEGRTKLQAMTVALADFCSRSLIFEATSLFPCKLSPVVHRAPSRGFEPMSTLDEEKEASCHSKQAGSPNADDAMQQQSANPAEHHAVDMDGSPCSPDGLADEEPARKSPYKQPSGTSAQMRRFIRFKDDVLHLSSLMHALALQHMRLDWCLDNLHEAHHDDSPPPLDSRDLKGYKDTWLSLFTLRSMLVDLQKRNRAEKLPVIGLISKQSKSLLKQSSELSAKDFNESIFSAVDVTSIKRLGVGRTLSFRFHGPTAVSMIEGGAERVYTVYNWLQLLLGGRAGEESKLRWGVPPPIATQVWTQLSKALDSFEECRKLVETPFPFPWAQTSIFLLLAYALTLPFLMVAYVQRAWLGCIIQFISVLTYVALNEISRDLEDPFICDPNDLPLARLQYDFNQRIQTSADTVMEALQKSSA